MDENESEMSPNASDRLAGIVDMLHACEDKRGEEMRLSAPATREQVEAFERGNGVTLPEEFKEWLIRFSDGGELFSGTVQFHGVAHEPLIDVNDGNRPDDTYVVIGMLGNGDPLVFKRGEERVSVYDRKAGEIHDDESYAGFLDLLEALPWLVGADDDGDDASDDQGADRLAGIVDMLYGYEDAGAGMMDFLDEATEEQVAAFEKESGVTLPAEYKEWLTRFSDGGEVFGPGGFQFHGVAHAPTIDVNDDDRPDDTYIVIGTFCDGEPLVFQRGGERIFLFNHETGEIADDESYAGFFDFLEALPCMLGVDEMEPSPQDGDDTATDGVRKIVPGAGDDAAKEADVEV